MNDRFLFRVWNKKKKKYHEVAGVRIYSPLNDATYFSETNSIFEQCIGLHDKAGSLVFDGDILQDGNKLWEVCWSQSLCSFMLDDYEYDANGNYIGSGNLESFASDNWETLDMLVVGNIHEGVCKKQCDEVQK